MCDRGFPHKNRQILVRNNLVIPFSIQLSLSCTASQCAGLLFGDAVLTVSTFLLLSLCGGGTRNKLPGNLHELKPAWHLVIMANLQCYSQSRRPHGSRPFHDLTGIIPLFHHSIPEAVNRRTVSGGHSCQQLFWERSVTNSAIHKAAGLTFPSHSLIWLVLFCHSTIASLKPSMGEQSLGGWFQPVAFLGTAGN